MKIERIFHFQIIKQQNVCQKIVRENTERNPMLTILINISVHLVMKV
jgi:hypothetical protein